jgi:hypothetical protein
LVINSIQLRGWCGANLLPEVKNLVGRGKRLTPAEHEFMDTWRGQVATIQDVPGVLALLEIQ